MYEDCLFNFTWWIFLTYELFENGNLLVGTAVVLLVVALSIFVIFFEFLVVLWGLASFVKKSFKKVFF